MPSSADDLRNLLNSGPGGGSQHSEAKPRIAKPDGPATDRRRRVGPGHSNLQQTLDERRPSKVDSIGVPRIAVTDVVDRTVDRDRERSQPEKADDRSDTTPKGPRPTSRLQQAWIDPEETPFEPVPRPGNPWAARFISWLVMLALCGGLAWLILPELDLRLTNLETVELPNGVLTAQAVPLSPLRPATVSELFVDASSLPDGVLPKGTPIALLEGTTENGLTTEMREMTVPFDARFVSVDTLVGGVVMPGTPVATIYDPSKMYVIVTVQPDTLELLRRGMRATLYSEVLGASITGEVISAVPLLGTDHEPTTADLVNIRIKPDAGSVADFVPGIRFDAAIDLMSAPPNAQPLVITNAGHIDASGAPADLSGIEDDAENG